MVLASLSSVTGAQLFADVRGKRPATLHGFKDRTIDEATIIAWWSAADYNVAIVPEDKDWCVIDLDPKNGGVDNWNALYADRGTPPTYTVVTPSGGEHLYFYG